jgi:hypothetical protein
LWVVDLFAISNRLFVKSAILPLIFQKKITRSGRKVYEIGKILDAGC